MRMRTIAAGVLPGLEVGLKLSANHSYKVKLQVKSGGEWTECTVKRRPPAMPDRAQAAARLRTDGLSRS